MMAEPKRKLLLPEEFSTLNTSADRAFCSFLEKYEAEKSPISTDNPYADKITSFETISDVVDFEDWMNEFVRVEKDKVKLHFLREALDYAEKKKQELKEKVYAGYKGKNMQIDKDFNLYLDTMLEELSDQDVAWLLEWVQHDEVDNLDESESCGPLAGTEKLKSGFKKKYGKRWKSVLYATSHKMQKKNEEVETIDEAAKKKKDKPVKEIPRGRRKDVKGQSFIDFRGGDKGEGKEKNGSAANRFWSYDSTKKNRRKHPHPRKPEQSGEKAGKVDGNLKGRFKRYYGKRGEKSKNGKPAEAIRAAVKKLIAQGKWPTENGMKGLRKGWARNKSKKKG